VSGSTFWLALPAVDHPLRIQAGQNGRRTSCCPISEGYLWLDAQPKVQDLQPWKATPLPSFLLLLLQVDS
jgi:hypothetical protein